MTAAVEQYTRLNKRLQRDGQRNVKNTHHSSITELVLTQPDQDDVLMLLPMIAHLTQVADRWITWIVNNRVDVQLLKAFGVDTQKIRLIHCTNQQDTLWVTYEALSLGNSHTVIASPGLLSDSSMAHIEHAAYKGNAKGLLVRYKTQ